MSTPSFSRLPSSVTASPSVLTISSVSEFVQYTMVSQSIETVISVIASRDMTNTRIPLDLVLALDVSLSMYPVLDLVKRTTQYIIKHASADDRIAIIAYSNRALVVFRSAFMTQSNKRRASIAVNLLSVSYDTNIGDALIVSGRCAKKLIETAHSHAQSDINTNNSALVQPLDKRSRITSVLLFTDGRATEGIEDADALVALASIIPSECSLHTFGYGDAHDPNFLRSLADGHKGTYYFIKSDEDVAAAFGDCLGGLKSTTAQTIRVTVRPHAHTLVTPSPTSFPIVRNPDGSTTITIGDMQQGESRDLHMVIMLSATEMAQEAAPLFVCELEYSNVSDGKVVQATPTTLFIKRATHVTHTMANPLIDHQRNRLLIVKVSHVVKEYAQTGNLDKARASIDAALVTMRASETALSEYTLDLIASLQQMREGIRDRNTYAGKGVFEIASIGSMHAGQRSAGQAFGSASYTTDFKAMSQHECVVECTSNAALLAATNDDADEPPRKRVHIENEDDEQQSQAF
jgi:hypothetical protein